MTIKLPTQYDWSWLSYKENLRFTFTAKTLVCEHQRRFVALLNRDIFVTMCTLRGMSFFDIGVQYKSVRIFKECVVLVGNNWYTSPSSSICNLEVCKYVTSVGNVMHTVGGNTDRSDSYLTSSRPTALNSLFILTAYLFSGVLMWITLL